MGAVGGLITILLGIITYFIKESHSSNKETAIQVTNISRIISVSAEHFKGFEAQCNTNHTIIDKRFDNHEHRIIKLETKK
jgi:Leu/Phe-tRNA-protein transferase